MDWEIKVCEAVSIEFALSKWQNIFHNKWQKNIANGYLFAFSIFETFFHKHYHKTI